MKKEKNCNRCNRGTNYMCDELDKEGNCIETFPLTKCVWLKNVKFVRNNNGVKHYFIAADNGNYNNYIDGRLISRERNGVLTWLSLKN